MPLSLSKIVSTWQTELPRVFSTFRVRAGRLHCRRLLLWGLVIYLGLQALLAVLVPWAVTGPVTRLAAQALNRAVSIERARFNPFTLTLFVQGVRIQDLAPQTSDFVTVGSAEVNVSLASVWRLAPVLDALTVQDPRVRLTRQADGAFNISDLLDPAASTPPQPPAAQPARFALHHVSVQGGELHFDDLAQKTHHAVQQIEFSLPYVASFQDAVDTAVTPLLNARFHGGELRLGAQSKPFKASRETTLHLSVQGIDLASATVGLPMLAPWTLHRGQLDTQIQLTLRAASAQDRGPQNLVADAQAQLRLKDLDLGSPDGDRVHVGQLELGSSRIRLSLEGGVPGIAVEDGQLELAALRVGEGTAPAPAASHPEQASPAETGAAGAPPLLVLPHLKVHGVLADSRRQTVRVQGVHVEGMEALAHRLASGQWQGQALAARLPGHGRAPAQPAGVTPTDPAAPWQLAVDRVSWRQVAARWRDEAMTPAVDTGVQAFEGSIEGWSSHADAQPRFVLKTELMHGGRVALEGQAKLASPQVQTQLDVSGVNLAVAQPYLSQVLDLNLSEGRLDVEGQLGVVMQEASVPQVKFQGALAIADLYARETDTGDDFVRWKRFRANDIDMTVRPTALSGADRIRIGQLAWDEVFAKVIIQPSGRLNLQDILRQQPEASSRVAANAQPLEPPEKAGASKGPQIELGGVRVAGGRINFTDYFVKPNYSTNITDLKGSVSAVGPNTPPAKVNLQGRIEGDAPVTVQGVINPVAQTLYADIAAKAKGIDLPVLTPYSNKYAGYPIERGKLTLDVNYKIDKNKLSAQNRVFLDQLTFGDQVDSATATKLPVLLAVSLLKNSRGEIDLNLPISGSLSDPQFSIGAVVWRAVLNLLERAVSAPFRMLASLVGGDDADMGKVEFVPGTAVLTAEATARLSKLATALLDRPHLRLDLVGRVDPVAELGEIRKHRLHQRVLMARSAHPEPPDPATVAALRWDPQEYARLLQKVYERSTLPNKPRNAIGWAKQLPAAEMESLLMEATVIKASDFNQLAQDRAHAVRDRLIASGLSNERLFTLAPSTEPASSSPTDGKTVSAEAASGQCLRDCVQFSLR